MPMKELNSLTSHGFLVLGMHRSGTSALTRALNILGLRLADELVEPAAGNPLGHWEPWPVVKLNDRLLKAFDRTWVDPKPMPGNWMEGDRARALLADGEAFLRTEFGATGGFVVKDPRLSRTARIWSAAFEACRVSPVCLIACRNPLEVSASLYRRDGISTAHALQLWLTYMLEAEHNTRGMRRAVIHFDAMLTDWQSATAGAFRDAGIAAPMWAEPTAQAVGASLELERRHHAATTDQLTGDPHVSSDVKETYLLFRSPHALAQTDAFDRIRRRWTTDWEARSDGAGASSFVQDMPETHLRDSNRLAEMDDVDGAVEAARRAAVLAPHIARYQFQLARLAMRQGRLEEAELACRTALDLDPHAAQFHSTLSHILNRLDRWEEAVVAACAAVQLAPGNAHLHHHLSVLYAKLDRFDAAEAACSRAVELDPERAEFHFRHSHILRRLGRRQAAISAIRRAVELAPDSAFYREALDKIAN